MPQVVDLEALVCGGGTDGKIVCETVLPGAVDGAKSGETPLSKYEADQPAESFRLPVGDEIDWVDRNAAAFYDRDDSTKEVTNPKSTQHHNNPNPNPKLHSGSQRFAGKNKAHIIGLPNKLQHSGYLGRSARRHAANVRFFPKNVSGARQRGKSAEPTSPKVSCIGRVLSDRDRNRRPRGGGSSDTCKGSSSVTTTTTTSRQAVRGGCLAAIFVFSCCGRGSRSAGDDDLPSSDSSKIKTTPSAPGLKEGAGEMAPGLGGLKRFASGRRPAFRGADAELATRSGPLLGTPQDGTILARRSVGRLEDVDCGRAWDRESGGPASV